MNASIAAGYIAVLLCFSFPVCAQPTHTIVELKIARSDSAYSIDGAYPNIEGLPDTAAQSRCNNSISFLANGWLKGFISSSRTAFAGFMSHEHTGPVSFLDISYNVELSTDRFLSLTIDWSGSLPGYAHPRYVSAGLSFDLTTGNEIFLYDLFEQGSHYLDTLSHYCIQDLLGQNASLGKVIEGTSPSYGNFHNFTLDDESLTIIFGPEQADTYKGAPGGRTVSIPYVTLENIVRKNGPIGLLLK